jgi:hypothetical protein
MGTFSLAVQYAEEIENSSDYEHHCKTIRQMRPDQTLSEISIELYNEKMAPYLQHQMALMLVDFARKQRIPGQLESLSEQKRFSPKVTAQMLRGQGKSFFDGWFLHGSETCKSFADKLDAEDAEHLIKNIYATLNKTTPWHLEGSIDIAVVEKQAEKHVVKVPTEIFDAVQQIEMLDLLAGGRQR